MVIVSFFFQSLFHLHIPRSLFSLRLRACRFEVRLSVLFGIWYTNSSQRSCEFTVSPVPEIERHFRIGTARVFWIVSILSSAIAPQLPSSTRPSQSVPTEFATLRFRNCIFESPSPFLLPQCRCFQLPPPMSLHAKDQEKREPPTLYWTGP